MNPTRLHETWLSIHVPARGALNGRRVDEGRSGPEVWAALDVGSRWHLLVRLADGEKSARPEVSRGFELEQDRLVVASEPEANYAVLRCTDPLFRDAFAAVAAEIVTVLGGVSQTSPIGEVIAGTLARWRRFWAVPPAPLSQEAALGLFGELWFMERWLGLPGGVQKWHGPSGARHDFQWTAASVEVKTCRASQETVRHHISSLDQLADAEAGELYLFSLQVSSDALAANSLPQIVSRIGECLAGDLNAHSRFLDQLATVGYNPAHAHRYAETWRVQGEGLYQVGEGFPRLVRRSFPTGLPAGIADVEYSLDMAACVRWRVAIRPGDVAATPLRE